MQMQDSQKHDAPSPRQVRMNGSALPSRSRKGGGTRSLSSKWPLLDGLTKFARMRVINRYLFKTVAATFGMSLLVVTFMLLMGSLVKIFELLFKKFSIVAILHLLAFIFPEIICYALPFSMAAATLLVFSRLSADGEITAMKATGISVFRIAAPCLALSVVVALIAVYAYNNILPRARFVQRNIVSSYDIRDIGALIETGSWTPLGRYRIFVDLREGKMFRNIHIIEDLPGGRKRQILAARAFIKPIRRENRVLFEMYDVVSEERSERHTNSYIRMKAGRIDMYVAMSRLLKKKSQVVKKKEKHHTTAELERLAQTNTAALAEIARRHDKTVPDLHADLVRAKKLWRSLQREPAWEKLLKERKRKAKKAFVDNVSDEQLHGLYDAELRRIEDGVGPATTLLRKWRKAWMPVNQVHNYLDANSRVKTEINYRYSYALASIAFAIIGIPLGIRAHRSEKTIGFLICLALIAIHYALVISVTSFNDVYVIRPDILVWIPDLLFIVIGAALLWRLHRCS